MSPSPSQRARRTIFVNPRFQGRAAAYFAAVVFAGGALFAASFYRYATEALRAASLQGHYPFRSPHEVVGRALAWQVLSLSVVVLAASLVVLLLLVRRVRSGVGRLIKAFLLSQAGDLSTPTEARALAHVTDLGGRIDAARLGTLSTIHDIRAEVEFLRSEPLSDEAFAARWDGLKAAIRRLAP